MKQIRQTRNGTFSKSSFVASIGFLHAEYLTISHMRLDLDMTRYSRNAEKRDAVMQYAQIGLACAGDIGGDMRDAMSQMALYANLRPETHHNDSYQPEACCYVGLQK